MAKGDDALARKRNRVRRKRLRSSENAVSARVAAIIASKRRRKSGKRRGCEGMCFSLPTPDDPFNERHGKKRKGEEPTDDDTADADAVPKEDNPKKKDSNTKKQPPAKAGAKSKAIRERATEAEEGRVDFDRPSKFLVVCLNAIRDAVAPEDGGGGSTIHGAGDWGVELWRSCSAPAPSDVLDTSGASATMEQTAWLVSTACDIVARKERLGMVVSCPFLLYLVPSQEKATQVRSICKPLKPLGIHSVSLHPGASVEHQISGLKTCEPEFLIATPERLLELVSLKAIDISNVSMLHVHFCPSEELKTSKVKEILEQILQSHAKKSSKVLLEAASNKHAQQLSSSLKQGNCTVTDGSHGNSFTICSSVGLMNVHVKDRENLSMTDVKEFETVLIVDLPPSVDEYVEILTGVARQTIGGEVHSLFCNTDARVAKPLAQLLANCSQVVPEFLKKLEFS
ncbi:unnamed protein product [Urochloa humidicola]